MNILANIDFYYKWILSLLVMCNLAWPQFDPHTLKMPRNPMDYLAHTCVRHFRRNIGEI